MPVMLVVVAASRNCLETMIVCLHPCSFSCTSHQHGKSPSCGTDFHPYVTACERGFHLCEQVCGRGWNLNVKVCRWDFHLNVEVCDQGVDLYEMAYDGGVHRCLFFYHIDGQVCGKGLNPLLLALIDRSESTDFSYWTSFSYRRKGCVRGCKDLSSSLYMRCNKTSFALTA